MPLISCRNCKTVYEVTHSSHFKCEICDHLVTKRDYHSFEISLALVIAALFIAIPALTEPIMLLTKLGEDNHKTIFQGVKYFWTHHDYFIAIVIFTASIFIPLFKIIGLLIIYISLKIHLKMNKKTKLWIFNFIKFIGKYSMIDIYVTALLASIAILGEIFSIKGDVAITSFTFMVILTSLSAHYFDTRIIWDE